MCERMGLSIPVASKKRTLAWCYVCGKKLVVFNPLSLPLRIPDIVLSQGTSQTGTTIASSQYDFDDNETINVLVDACDDAAAPNVTGGSQNCTAKSTPKTFVLPDVNAPPSFLGHLWVFSSQ